MFPSQSQVCKPRFGRVYPPSMYASTCARTRSCHFSLNSCPIMSFLMGPLLHPPRSPMLAGGGGVTLHTSSPAGIFCDKFLKMGRKWPQVEFLRGFLGGGSPPYSGKKKNEKNANPLEFDFSYLLGYSPGPAAGGWPRGGGGGSQHIFFSPLLFPAGPWNPPRGCLRKPLSPCFFQRLSKCGVIVFYHQFFFCFCAFFFAFSPVFSPFPVP